MARVSRISLYVTVYLLLCLLANLGLVVVFLGGPQGRRAHRPQQPAPVWTPSSGQPLGCAELPVISNLTLIGSGWTKAVYRGWYGSTWVAVKTVHTSGHDMNECEEEVSVCYKQCATKLLKEAHMLQELSHGNVIKVFGECAPEVEYSPGPPRTGVAAVMVEVGRPVRVVEVLQMGYEARLRLAVDVGRILHLLAHSSFGSLLMKDFRREQFIIVDGSLKLSDVDDAVVGDPACVVDQDCVVRDGVKETVLVKMRCEHGVCRGFNSILNSIYASQHFMRILIPYGGPPALEKVSLHLVDQMASGELDSEDVHNTIQALAHNYSTGAYLTSREKEEVNNFDVFPESAVHGEDFPCLRMESVQCVQSVSCPAEGASLCSQLPGCVAFVLLDQWTWTGRQVAVFKAGAKEVRPSDHHTVYIRRGKG